MQLAEALQSSDPKIPVETVEVEKEGVCIRYCPLENAQGMHSLFHLVFLLTLVGDKKKEWGGFPFNASTL